MSTSEDIGMLNEAGLRCGEMAALIEQAAELIDQAEYKFMDIRRIINEVRGDAEIQTLILCARKVLEGMEACRGSQNYGTQAILAGNNIQDLIQEYIAKLHG